MEQDWKLAKVIGNHRCCVVVEGEHKAGDGPVYIQMRVKKLGGFIALGVADHKIDIKGGGTGCAFPGAYMYACHGYTYHNAKGSRFGITDTRFKTGDDVGVLIDDMPDLPFQRQVETNETRLSSSRLADPFLRYFRSPSSTTARGATVAPPSNTFPRER